MSSNPSSSSTPAWLADGGALFGIGLGEEITTRTIGPQAQIGPYRLLEKLGEGGLGVVWRAAQTSPIQREVAIKLTKPGMHYRADVLTRFELERQALARMQHPNIAAILDAGSLPDERPYFVMELVQGVPLTSYCNQHKLTIRQRLELFIVICQAVHHAHQKGILHRDLKPSNILVAEQDGQPLPKIIDFGIAKALDETDPALNDPFFKTQPGALPCATYQYMSPEQASRGQTDIDTRSDIYTLGVILYELLTGLLPLPEELARGGNFEAIASYLRDSDPTRPSQRVTTAGTRTSDLRGDLDWIVLRALERNRDRRYESAAALAEDVQRHLDHEPVNAGPPSMLYRCGKWMRRHRVAFVSIAAVALSLCAGLLSTWMALQREAVQRRRADESRAQAEASQRLAEQREHEAVIARDAEASARQRAESAQKVADIARSRAEALINDMLYDLRDKLEPLGRLPLLEQVAQSAQDYFNEVPAGEDNDAQQRNRAVVLQNRGSILLARNDAAGAKALFEQSLAVMKARAAYQPHNVQRLHDLALAHQSVAQVDEVLKNDVAALAGYEEMRLVFDHLLATAPQDESAWRLDCASGYERLGDCHRRMQQAAKALECYQAAAKQLEALPVSEKRQMIEAVLEGKLGGLDAANAQAHYTYEASLWDQLARTRPDDVRVIAGQAIAHGHLALLKQGLEDARLQAAGFARLLQFDPQRLEWRRGDATAQFQLAIAMEQSGDSSEAARGYEEALKRFEALPDSTRDQAGVQLRMAALKYRRKDVSAAKQHAQRVLDLLQGLGDAQTEQWRKTAAELLAAP